jgi:hypothetical protein
MIDCFPFFNELDLLEVRLNALAPYVDRFVLAEGRKTYSGKPKPLFFADNRERFAGFDITHVITPSLEGGPWELECWGRECLLANLGPAARDEVILISDVDEIPDLAGYEGAEGVFEHDYFYRYFDCSNGVKWRGTFAVKSSGLSRNHTRARLRKWLKRRLPVVGGGWHFTSLGSRENFIYKLESYAHQELNTEENKCRIREEPEDVDEWVKLHGLLIKPPSGPAWLLANWARYPQLFLGSVTEVSHD